MGITHLSPDLVRQLVWEEEAPGRQRHLSPDAVAEVFRFGAMVGSEIHRFAELDRGMDYAKQLVRDSEARDCALASGTVILAETLTGGRGRFRRVWHAPPGGIWMTLVLANTLLPETSRLYPLAAGLACCEAIRHFGINCQLKWVNDVHVQGRKIAGILAETMIGPRFGEEYVLIGIGINANNEAFPPELADTAVAMCSLLGEPVDLEALAARLLAKLNWAMGLLHYEERQWLADDDGSRPAAARESMLVAQWRGLSDTIGRRVWFGYDVQQNPQYEALVIGLTADGGLILQHLADDVQCVEYSGEILYC